jgi:hypothetical protein
MLDTSKIVKTYSGKVGCMCGCLGKYSYTTHGAAEDGPGYDVTDSVNERSVRIIANKVLRNPNTKFEDSYAFVVEGNRIKAVFFKEQA